jgi:hypothetical protein
MARSALTQLEQLRDREIAARHQVRQVERERDLAGSAVAEAKELLTQAIQRGEDQRTPTKELRKAEERAGQPWAERVEAAQRGAAEAASAVSAFIASNYPRLRAELAPQAEQVRERMLAALQAVEDTAKEWEAMSSVFNRILPAAGIVPRYAMPQLGISSLLSEIRKVHDIPAPMPAGHQVASAASMPVKPCIR